MVNVKTETPILIIEDEKNIATLVSTYLNRSGFGTILAHDGEAGMDAVRNRRPGLVILDLMLPGMDGWDVCREIRKISDVPILILTAREEEMDRVLGFSLGADDYVVKPFSPRELVERVKAILRRVQSGASQSGHLLHSGDLRLDAEKHKVTLGDRPVSLTPIEFKLLETFMRAPGRVFSRGELLDRIYQHDESVVDRVIDVHIGKLRQKIEADSSRPVYVLTVRGIGYQFAESPGAEDAED
ncbi:MAG: response regulator transcription factor [bacterium]|nr:response regulator transcription factor [bacterium]